VTIQAPQRWVEITVTVEPKDVDAVAYALREVAPNGVVIHPAIRIDDDADFVYEELAEPQAVVAAVPAPFEVEARRDLQRRLMALDLQGPLGRITYHDVEAQDWSQEWKRFYTIQRIGRRLVVHPSWEPYEASPGEAVITLDPGTAFGTAEHETTRLCLAALDRHLRRGQDVIDVGTGSGILAIAAAKLGAGSVRALDNDPEAIEVARANVLRNGAARSVKLGVGSMGLAWPWAGQPVRDADIVVVNISSSAIVEMMPDLVRALRRGGLLIASGFMAGTERQVFEAAEAAHLSPLRVDADGDWRCFVASGIF
jgi:ribosomal protein L11 methyltransferase